MIDDHQMISEAVGLSPELRALETEARALVEAEILPKEFDETDEAGLLMTKKMGEAGLLNACVSLDVPKICLLREVVAQASGLADSMLALQGLGYGPIALAGTEAQKAKWQDKVVAGEAICAIAITEPEAGSDVGAISTTAELQGDHYVLNGKKHFITNAGIADFYVVIARTSGPGSRGLSALIVERDQVAKVERYELVAPHPCGALTFENAKVPKENLVGEEGQGFKIAMRTLDHFRPTVGAAANGMAGRALREATRRARSRNQFGQAIGRFQLIGAHLAESWTELMAGRLLVFRAAAAHEAGDPQAGAYASAAKMFATESAQKIIDRAVQVYGGEGVRKGSVVERLYREIRALRIYEGTTEIQKVVLSRALLGKL